MQLVSIFLFFISYPLILFSQVTTRNYYTTLYDQSGNKYYDGYVMEQKEERVENNIIRRNIKIYRHGRGTLYFSNSPNSYKTGEFIYDQLNGYGEMHANGIHYVGNWRNNQQNGHGKQWSDGAGGTSKYVYEGNFVNDVFSGKGRFEVAGAVYEGDFANGQYSGQGKLSFSNSDYYIGNFQSGFMNGYGEYFYSNGDWYKGNWVSGRRTGQGEYYTASTRTYQRGLFENNVFNGIASSGNTSSSPANETGSQQKVTVISNSKQTQRNSSDGIAELIADAILSNALSGSSSSGGGSYGEIIGKKGAPTTASSNSRCSYCVPSSSRGERISDYNPVTRTYSNSRYVMPSAGYKLCKSCWGTGLQSQVGPGVCNQCRGNRFIKCSNCNGTGKKN